MTSAGAERRELLQQVAPRGARRVFTEDCWRRFDACAGTIVDSESPIERGDRVVDELRRENTQRDRVTDAANREFEQAFRKALHR